MNKAMATSVSCEGRKNKVDTKYVAREKETTLKASLAVNYISPRNSKFGKVTRCSKLVYSILL